jgi:hypothetical protein
MSGLITIKVIDWASIFINFNSVSETPSHNLLTVKNTAEYLRIPLPQFITSFNEDKFPPFKLADAGE